MGSAGVGVYVYDGPTTGDPSLFQADPFTPEDVQGSCDHTPVPTASTPVPALNGAGLALLLLGLGGIGVMLTRRVG